MQWFSLIEDLWGMSFLFFNLLKKFLLIFWTIAKAISWVQARWNHDNAEMRRCLWPRTGTFKGSFETTTALSCVPNKEKILWFAFLRTIDVGSKRGGEVRCRKRRMSTPKTNIRQKRFELEEVMTTPTRVWEMHCFKRTDECQCQHGSWMDTIERKSPLLVESEHLHFEYF